MISINLHTLNCRRIGKKWGKTRPYLWTIFFTIDGKTVTLVENFQLTGKGLFYFTEGSHGNLDTGPVEGGEEIMIPSEIGTWRTTLRPVKVPFFEYEIPGMVGVVTALMLEKNVSYKGAEAGHQALNWHVEEAVNQSIAEFDVKEIDVENILSSLKAYFSRKTDLLASGIETAVKSEVVRTQNVFQNLWTLLNRDELIGYQVWDFSMKDLDAANGIIRFRQEWEDEKNGSWELLGIIKKEEDYDREEPPEESVIHVSIESEEEKE